MKFISLTALALSIFVNQAMSSPVAGLDVAQDLEARQTRVVAFNVAPAGVSCGDGTTITCTLTAAGQSCKGNFTPAQASIVVTEASFNCHISLYAQPNQQGDVVERVDTDTTGECVFTSVATWESYGVFCQ